MRNRSVSLLMMLSLPLVIDTTANQEPSDALTGRVVEMEVAVAGTVLDVPIEIGLFDAISPFTTDNFYQLCVNGYYDGSPFHRVVPGFMLQGGDYTKGDGTGGAAFKFNADDPDEFDNENFVVRHRPFVIAMANAGPNTNGSQFYITLAETEWLDGTTTVFGRVENGKDVVREMESYGTPEGATLAEIELVRCRSRWDPYDRASSEESDAPESEDPQGASDSAPNSSELLSSSVPGQEYQYEHQTGFHEKQFSENFN